MHGMNTVPELIDHPQLAARDRWRDVPSPAGAIRMLKPPLHLSKGWTCR
jgi:crotonobetainyl-CoA:carnitine CoA-transferase CaiB-like acyl-CoA transferase